MRALVFMLLICLGYLSVTHAQMDTLNGEPVYTVVEEMPYPISCKDAEDLDKCRNMKMVEFIYLNITYPPLQRGDYYDVMVIISFVINKEGEMVDVTIVRDPNGWFGEDAKRVVQLMGDEMNWVAGKEGGKPIAVKFNIPVRYKMR